MKNNSGFSAVEVLVVVLVLGLIGFVGYVYVSRQSDNASIPAKVATDVPDAPKVETKEDLIKVESTLDGIDLDDTSDKSSLDAALASF